MTDPVWSSGEARQHRLMRRNKAGESRPWRMRYDLFDLEPAVWVPVRRELTPAIRELLDRFANGGVLPTDSADWKAWHSGERCSECGGLMSTRPHSHGCDGTTTGPVCDDCAPLARRWGVSTT